MSDQDSKRFANKKQQAGGRNHLRKAWRAGVDDIKGKVLYKVSNGIEKIKLKLRQNKVKYNVMFHLRKNIKKNQDNLEWNVEFPI